ncbi:DUF7674 family protein [Actinomycetospora sp.]|jgi:hypothetical protein|uniref:DUF7674 family protein n=1 Tax=Actinomycetospora sp. TaxID=1872135 RepID=UPI002F3E8BD7
MADTDDEPPDLAGPILADALGKSSARAAEMVREHVEFNDEVLSTVLLGGFGRWYWSSLQEGRSDAPDALRAAQVLGELFADGDDEMETVIATGFLEALPHPSEDGREVVEQLPSSLRGWLRHMENWKPTTVWNPTR